MAYFNPYFAYQQPDEGEMIEEEDSYITYSQFPGFQGPTATGMLEEEWWSDEDEIQEDPSLEIVPVVASSAPRPLILTSQRSAGSTEPLTFPSGTLYGVSDNDQGLLANVLPQQSAIHRAATALERATEPLAMSDMRPSIPLMTTSPSLAAVLQATMTSSATSRIVVIPGSDKRKRAEVAGERTTPSLRMSPRLRQGIVLTTLLVVVLTSLASLIPLAGGQSPFPIFRGISGWFQDQQLIWQLPAHQAAATQKNPSAPALPPMSIPSSQYVAIARQDAIDAGISPDYFVRQINLESGFNPNSVSPAGAVGIAQFLPGTAAGLGINPWDPIQALRGAARLMASYASKYGGNYAMALAAYNGGSGTVQYAVNNCGPNWMNCLPFETRNYIYVIMGI